MGDWFLGEIRLFAFSKAPTGWRLCDGSLLQIAQNQALYSLLSTYYGGDGKTTFGVPDLRGRTPLGRTWNASAITYNIGDKGGSSAVTLTLNNLPPHNHTFNAQQTAATSGFEASNLIFAQNAAHPIYAPDTNLVALNANSISTEGGGGPHDNMQPFQVLNYCVATQGLYPPHD